MRLTITVTSDDIANGKPGQATSCPVALGAYRAGVAEALVGPREIRYGRGWVPLPRSAIRFVRAFDHGRPVAPFRFRLNVPKEAGHP